MSQSIITLILNLYNWGLENLTYILGALWIIALFVYLMKLFIPKWDQFTRFGKLEVPQKFIISIDNKLGWIMFYSFSCIVFFITYIIRWPPHFVNIFLFIHSFRRLLESLFITNFSSRQMNIINLLAGLLFYIMVPFTLAQSSKSEISQPIVWFGVIIALNVAQFYVHWVLAGLKKYTIPEGLLFRKCTSPHYLIEILLYIVYFLCAPSILTVFMVIFVAFNLTHQSIMTYNWYLGKFGNEFVLMKRNVLVPFIF